MMGFIACGMQSAPPIPEFKKLNNLNNQIFGVCGFKVSKQYYN